MKQAAIISFILLIASCSNEPTKDRLSNCDVDTIDLFVNMPLTYLGEEVHPKGFTKKLDAQYTVPKIQELIDDLQVSEKSISSIEYQFRLILHYENKGKVNILMNSRYVQIGKSFYLQNENLWCVVKESLMPVRTTYGKVVAAKTYVIEDIKDVLCQEFDLETSSGEKLQCVFYAFEYQIQAKQRIQVGDSLKMNYQIPCEEGKRLRVDEYKI